MNKITSAKLLFIIMLLFTLIPSANALDTYSIPFNNISVSLDDTVYETNGIYGILINNPYNESINVSLGTQQSSTYLGSCITSCTIELDDVTPEDVIRLQHENSLLIEIPLFNLPVQTSSVLTALIVDDNIVMSASGQIQSPIVRLTTDNNLTMYVNLEDTGVIPIESLRPAKSVLVELLDGTAIVDSVKLSLPEKNIVKNVSIKLPRSETLFVNSSDQVYFIDNITSLMVNVTELRRESSSNSLLSSIIALFTGERLSIIDSTLRTEIGREFKPSQYTDDTIELNITPLNESGFYSLSIISEFKGSRYVDNIVLAKNGILLPNNRVVIKDRDVSTNEIVNIVDKKNNTVQTNATFISNSTLRVIPQEGLTKSFDIAADRITGYFGKELRFEENVTNISTHNFTSVFAIDPSSLNITNITLIRVATGNSLYKCKDWNFSTQKCMGEWTFLRSVIPGQEYTLTIDNNDPAFGEQSDLLKMEWGTISNVNDTWQTINLTLEYNRPVIVTTPHYQSVGTPVVSRITNITASSFSIRLQVAAPFGNSTTRNINYVVMEEGSWRLKDGTKVEAWSYNETQTDNDADWTPVPQSYLQSYTAPVVIGQVMSYNNPDWSVFWVQGSSRTSSVSSTNLQTGKTVTQDPSTTRATEEVGVMVFETAHGTIGSVEYDSSQVADSIKGVGNAPPYAVNFGSVFSSAPSIVLASNTRMDGANGGWMVAYGNTTNTQVRLAEEEYDSGERSHTSEPASVVAFTTAGYYIGNDAPAFIDPRFNSSQVEPQTAVLFSVNVTDFQNNFSVQWVNATYIYPNSTRKNISLAQEAVGATVSTKDQEPSTRQLFGKEYKDVLETGIIDNVSSWQQVTLKNTFIDPLVFTFTLRQADVNGTVEQAIANVKNISSSSFAVSVVLPDNTFTVDDVGYVVVERGSWSINGSMVQAGSWPVADANFNLQGFDTPFTTNPSVFLQLQDQNTAHWYTGRYTLSSLNTTHISIQFEDKDNYFSGSYEAAYLGIEQGAVTSYFEAQREAAVGSDPPTQNTAISFTNGFTEPIMMGIISEAGGDPAKLGVNSLIGTGANVRTVEETYSDTEQNHAVDDVLWLAFENNLTLANDTSVPDEDSSSRPLYYDDVSDLTTDYISTITAYVDIASYDPSASIDRINSMPALEISMNTFSGWKQIGTLSGIGNKSVITTDADITGDWSSSLSIRDIKIQAVNMDWVNSTLYDNMTFDALTLEFEQGNKTVRWKYIFTEPVVGKYNISDLYAFDGYDINHTSYSISYNVTDLTPPIFTFITNITIETSAYLGVDFDSFDISGIQSWNVNNTDFTINNTGYLTNSTVLTENTYSLNITTTDTYANSNYELIRVNVTSVPDVIAPIFTHSLTNITARFGRSFSYDINATDDRGIIGDFAINDTSRYSINAVNGVLVNNSAVLFGSRKLNVSVNDTSGNTNYSTLSVITPHAAVSSDKSSYGYNAIVNITGNWYSIDTDTQITIQSLASGGTVTGYPKSVYSDGSITDTWNTTNYCPGSYEITVDDEIYPNNLTSSSIFDILYRDLTPKTCADQWGGVCDAGPPDIDNTWDACSTGLGGDESIDDITLNTTQIGYGDSINVSCVIDPYTSQDYYRIWYYNGSVWRRLYSENNTGSASVITRSVVFTPDNVSGTHWVRCVVEYQTPSATECGDGGGSGYYDNDDISFEVRDIPSSCFDLDGMPPNTTLLSPINKTINISSAVLLRANVSDENTITSVEATVSLENTSKYIVSLYDGDGDGIYESTFSNTYNTGHHNVTINAVDEWNNINNSSIGDFIVQLYPLAITTNKQSYLVQDIASITGKGFDPSELVTINIYNGSGVSITGYPKNKTSSIAGVVTDSWSIPVLQELGMYTINMTQVSDSSKTITSQFSVVEAVVEAQSETFSQGSTILISGYNWGLLTNVTLNISDPSSSVVYGPKNVTSTASGLLSDSWFVPYDGALGGGWSIGALQPSNTNKTNIFWFSVTPRVVSLSTGYTWYTDNENVTFVGSGVSSYANVTVSIKNSTSVLTGYPKNITANSSGGFESYWVVPSLEETGVYSVNIFDSLYPNLNGSVAFTIVTENMSTDKYAYKSGDLVQITGYNFNRLSNVTIRITNSTGNLQTGYPKNVTATANGVVVDTWTAQPGGGFGAENYNIVLLQSESFEDNVSAMIDVTKAATLYTDKKVYFTNENVSISGGFYALVNNVSLELQSSTGATALDYPKMVITDATGNLTDWWNVSDYCKGDYTVYSVDQSYPLQLNANVSFRIDSRDTAPKTCADQWGGVCDAGPPDIDNTWDACSTGLGGDESIDDAKVNATVIVAGDMINVSCVIDPYTSQDYYRIWYYNGSVWRRLYSENNTGSASVITRSVVFTPDNVSGTQWVRCVIEYQTPSATECGDGGGSGYYDNDDVSFIVRPNDQGACTEFDATPPSVLLVGSLRKTYNYTDEVLLEANVTDFNTVSAVGVTIVYPDSSTVNLTMTDNDANGIYNTTFNDTFQFVRYNYTIYARDNWNNKNETQSSYFNISRPLSIPVVSVLKPANGVGDNDGTVTFNYSVSNITQTASCTLDLGNGLNNTKHNITSGLDSFTFINLPVGSYVWNVTCIDDLSLLESASSSRTIDVVLTTDYNGTDLSSFDVEAIPNFFVRNSKGKVNFTNTVNLSGGVDINSIINLSYNFIDVDVSSEPRLNVSATLQLDNLPYTVKPDILRNNVLCSTCTPIDYNSGVLQFSVISFSNYTTTSNSELYIFDENDTGHEKQIDEQVIFYANYTNKTSGVPITGLGAYCSVIFDVNGWSSPVNMTYNSESGLYEYNRTFSTNNTYDWNVTCDGSSLWFEPANISDTIIISTVQNRKPRMESVTIKPVIANVNDNLIGYCNATDQDGDNQSYSWVWFRNGVVNETGNTNNWSSGWSWSYQETPNNYFADSTWDSFGAPGYIYDGVYSTFAYSTTGGYYFANYTKPVGAKSSSKWQVKGGSVFDNKTIVAGCWNQNPLQFRLFDNWGTGTLSYSCFDGGSWSSMGSDPSPLIYEEAMQWNISTGGSANYTQGVEVLIGNVSFSWTSFADNWTFSCQGSDGSLKTGWINSSTRYINTSQNDLELSYVYFSTENPVEDKQTVIYAVITNSGTSQVNNVLVEFNDTSTHLGNQTISSLPAGTNTTVTFAKKLSLGNHTITVYVDSDSSVSETNETNNNKSRNLFVSSWHTYYGRVASNKTLADENNNSIITWVPSITTGNIYFVDSDASVSWSDVTEITRTTTGALSSIDFTELDAFLGLTGKFDSTSKLFGSDVSTPISTQSMNIFGKTLPNVPVTNSTNSSTFTTGILWDSSDGTNNEFDENETVIFVTQINENRTGKYGIYDYEIRVPSGLKNTEGVNPHVDVYLELT